MGSLGRRDSPTGAWCCLLGNARVTARGRGKTLAGCAPRDQGADLLWSGAGGGGGCLGVWEGVTGLTLLANSSCPLSKSLAM